MPVTLTVTPHGLAHVTLDRPAKRNALDGAMIASLHDRVAELATRSDARVVVVRGAGGTFCAGADIADWVAPSNAVAAEQSRLGTQVFNAVAALPIPSVAVLEGITVGGGFELAMACDLRIAAADVRIGLPELGLGNLPSWGGTARLVDVAGLGVARHLLLSGELITGARAADLHVVTSAHATADLDHAVTETVDRLLGAEPLALALAKRALAGFESHLDQEDALAAYTAGLDSSRSRKQDFLDRKAAAKSARSTAPALTTAPEGTAS